ncbi:hypothetical protein COM62_28545 [Bacillus pseudomycoides]|nr:hypothetical protein COM62_28545 [Bacillus pseudomycoides]
MESIFINWFSPHHNQAKKSKYPETRKLASPCENVHFFVLGCYKILKLMGMGYHQHFGKTPR